MQIKILGGDEVRSEGWFATYQALLRTRMLCLETRYFTLNKSIVISGIALPQKTADLVNKTEGFCSNTIYW